MLLKYALEMTRVLGVRELALARQVQIVQARYPETQRGGAQHYRPCVEFDFRKWPYFTVSAEQRSGTLAIEYCIGRNAPVVDRNSAVIEQSVVACKIEIDDAADSLTVPQHVVAEQIGMDYAARQISKTVMGLEA